ncbi:MAG: ATP-binding cassette domain-containing protein [Phycisphaerales bacterium]|nr:ATP-binding cassette domain-containing protein [Phycisphaerales bacterium]
MEHAAAPTQAPGKPVIACQGLTKVFRDFWMRSRAKAVDNLSFEVHPREIFGLLGPNGSGKSTTIKIILGLLRPTRGRIAVFGKPPTDVATKKRIGYLPEESYLYPFLNARETLDYYGKLFELPHAIRRRRTDELLDMVGLTHVQHRPIREYSKGMQRRIGLAQALINDPDLLILDEPTTGLDPIGTRQVKDLILELGRRGKTVLLSSHLLADVEDCVDRMVILYGGRKRDEGTCDSLLVSRERTTIETDALDDDTVAEIDALLRRRSGGTQSVLRVSSPRQTLEQKFLSIVELARAERVETAGALHGGETASFLRAPEGDELISRLTEEEPPSPPDQTAPAPAPAEERERVIEGLLGDGAGDTPHAPQPETPHDPPAGPERRPTPTPPPAPPAKDVDASVIDSLLADPDSDKTEDGRT